MSDKRKEKLAMLIEKRDAYRAKDFDKVDAINNANAGNKAKKSKPMTMNHVYLDVALAVFFMLTMVGAPLGLFFAVTAIFKYSLVRQQRKEPRA